MKSNLKPNIQNSEMFDGCIFKILIENAKKVGFFNLKHIQNQALLCRPYNVCRYIFDISKILYMQQFLENGGNMH